MGPHTIHMGACIEKLWVTQASTTITGKESVKVTLFTFLFIEPRMSPYIMWIQYSLVLCSRFFVLYVLKHITCPMGYIKL